MHQLPKVLEVIIQANGYHQHGSKIYLLVSDKTLSIAFLELYPIVISAILWGKNWKCKNILFWCDNEATVGIVKKGRSKCLVIMKLMRRLTW